MAVDQLPVPVREFANYLDGLLAQVDQRGGWCAVFWQRDPDGMQACLDGREVPPWDVVESVLHDLAAEYGPAAAAEETDRARALHAAALAAYDARPGGRDALGDRYDVMLREQRYAADRQTELGRLLASATTREAADAIRLDLAWASDDHQRATQRCAELRGRMEELGRRGAVAPPAGRGGGHNPSGTQGAGFARVGDGSVRDGSNRRLDDGFGAGGSPFGGRGGQDAGFGFGGGGGVQRPDDGFESGGAAHSGGGGAEDAGFAFGGGGGVQRSEGRFESGGSVSPGGRGGQDAGFAFGGGGGVQRPDDGLESGGSPSGGRGGHGGQDAGFRQGGVRPAQRPGDRAAPSGADGSQDVGFPQGGGDQRATGFPGMPRQRGAPEAGRGEGQRDGVRAGDPHDSRGRSGLSDTAADGVTGGHAQPAPSPEPTTPSPEPAPAPQQKQKKRRRGGARFAGMTEDEAAPAVVPPGAASAVPAPPVTTGRTPRGARFAGAAEVDDRPQPQAEPVDTAARRETVATVETLVRLRAEGRSGEAHVLLAEAAYWPAARFPLLAAEMQRAGLGADWATLLWETASLPAGRVVAAADALTEAGLGADGEQILRQGVARPAAEIGQAVRTLAAEGRRREIRALLDAYVRVRTPEEAARSAAPDPQTLVPLLLDAAGRVSQECHWDLLHALRVAGFTA
ncbi:hypothetical protein GR925_11305 [Streptomyces sp. HUCO-GS316]|uniref:hypothetical protein n=1 Tax=Streptomyces sp. HUCO-GS316 TaxID=2692198 RepID=UPI0013679E54|nr:hypothetical protein [Streptomyces sp. HUCO-GS316]MXM64018.1 hypothetical protein [Streptomyces sp. HUCO-GS316]